MNNEQQLSRAGESAAMIRSGAIGWDSAWDEEVRKDGAVGSMPFRCAIGDIEIGDVTMAKGEFDITRTDKTNLSFAYGRHRCLGPALATMHAMVALPASFERFPDLALAVPPAELEPQGTFIFNGYTEVRCG
jgi:2-hydroxy-5-methyl-1-naphthoate 7-hydroxylase